MQFPYNDLNAIWNETIVGLFRDLKKQPVLTPSDFVVS